MNKINQSYSINDLSAINLDDLPSLTFKDRLNRIKQNIKYRYLPFGLPACIGIWPIVWASVASLHRLGAS